MKVQYNALYRWLICNATVFYPATILQVFKRWNKFSKRQ